MISAVRRSGFMVPLFLVLFFYLFVAPAFAEKGGDRPCSKCKSTSKIPNPFMDEKLLALEKPVLFCSYIIENDKKGRGLPWLPCPKCRDTPRWKKVNEAFKKEMKKRLEWLEARRKATAFLKTRTPLVHLETRHFIIAWSIPKIVTEDKKVYRLHEAAHLYARRLEAFYDDFMETLGLEDKEMRNTKHFLYLFEAQKSCLKAAQELIGLNCWNAARLPGNPSILISWRDKSSMPNDQDFLRHIEHHLTHLLNVAYYRMEWLAMDAGWADEGLGHYFEIKNFKIAGNTCDEEGEEEELLVRDWEFEVRKAVDAGNAPSFADILVKTTTALEGDEHMFAWSYVDFLMHYRPRGFKIFMRSIKEKKGVREALKEGYGLNFISFQEKWQNYVLENYRKKPLKLPRPGPGRPKRKRSVPS